ncbi:hypothetical protein I6A60_18800 [Frankia sp. AgB1.9]|uniref:hypothetical protein n=1 Tax=unclassified Frankia TaxID=2632575 RepID=UPI0019329100|nr:MULTISPECIES: hypothetical protein [unclassified Frankia]MBL7492971.1 hypothetical protein [Frankia sp. AgW1.1]MBL7549910.1 hypothetical protein [Frankia sp. AgB1.9]MBL7620485.1 hypothetical protein [Frankia sp. AgB1.8]
MPAGSDARASGVPWKAWVEQRRRPVIIGAFVAAALLGILIGLLTAPTSKQGSGSAAPAVVAPAREPSQAPAPWAANRAPGTAVNVTLDQSMSPIVRTALAWAAADDALARAGRKTWSEVYLAAGSPVAGTANAQAATSRASLTDQSITIPQGLLYGAVQGTGAASDQFWAVGFADTTSTAVAINRLHVWERVGSDPWKVVASGAGACGKVPQSMTAVWGNHPEICNAPG